MTTSQGRFASVVMLFALVTTSPAVHASAPITVYVEGAVRSPGAQQHEVGSRFSDALEAAAPRRHAYPLGASVLRTTQHAEQVRQRAGVLHDLRLVAESSDVPGAVASRAATLYTRVDGLPATGRVPLEGNVRRLEVSLGDTNNLLASGDRILVPERPGSVTVIGAVQAPCRLPHVPDQNAVAYAQACAMDTIAADPDTLFVIQPDGNITKVGIANWNRSPVQALAPGAIVLVPFANRHIARLAPELNSALASFLATQPLPHDHLVTP